MNRDSSVPGHMHAACGDSCLLLAYDFREMKYRVYEGMCKRGS